VQTTKNQKSTPLISIKKIKIKIKSTSQIQNSAINQNPKFLVK
jgi:hypothetical protein